MVIILRAAALLAKWACLACGLFLLSSVTPTCVRNPLRAQLLHHDDDGDGRTDEDLSVDEPGVDQPPIAAGGSRTTFEDTPVHVVMTGFDPNFDVLRFDVISGPTRGHLGVYSPSVAPPPFASFTDVGPVLTYVPNTNVSGTDYFTFRVRDGSSSSATATVTITVLPVNDPPVFISPLPTQLVTEGVLFSHNLDAIDGDNDTLTYFGGQMPQGMTINASTGQVSWTPTNAQVGSQTFIFGVRDPSGAEDRRLITVRVGDVNARPSFTSTPPQLLVSVGQLFRYLPVVFDEDVGDVLRFTLQTAPPGMAISPTTGEVTWLPTPSHVGAHPVLLRARDGAGSGLFIDQSFTVTVVADTTPPTVAVSVSPQIVNPNQTLTISVTASDNIAIASRRLFVDGVEVTLDANNRATYRTGVAGTHDVQATATDPSGNSASASARFGVRDAADHTPPEVAIHTPGEDAIILLRQDVRATVEAPDLLSFTLSIKREDEGSYVTIASGTAPVLDQIIGQVDGTLLEDGIYLLRLDGTDSSGNIGRDEIPIEVQGEAKIGIVRLSFVDLAISMAGVPITVTRSYDSRVKVKRDFGIGWDLEVTAGRMQHNRTPGIGWNITGTFPPPGRACAVITELQNHFTTVRLSDREWYRFRPRLVHLAQTVGGCTGEVAYEFADGLSTGATLDVLSNSNIFYLSGTSEVVDDITLLPWTPDEVLLTTGDGRRITLRRGLGITRIEDLNDNAINIGSGGIVHSTGQSISFARDSQQRITRITDPLGQTLIYAYNTAGDLESVEDQAENTTSFVYDNNHLLLDIVNPIGVRAVRNEYDEDGRLIATIDADGRRIEIDHDLDAQAETTRDRFGNVTVHYYDNAGNVTRKIDALTHEWRWTYDSRGNELTATDALGRVAHRSYDSMNNVLTSTDADGDWVTFTRNSRGQVLTSRDSLGRIITNTYDGAGNLRTTTDGEGKLTTYSYNTRGEVLTIEDPLHHFTRFGYDTRGNQTSREDPLGHVTTTGYDTLNRRTSETRTRTLPSGATETLTTVFGYDANSKPTTTRDPLNFTSTVEWDALGKPSVSIAKNGLRTEFVSNSRGLLSRINHADGTYDETIYDLEGRVLSERDREGAITTHQYDALGRRTKTTHPDLSYTETTYDAIGRVLTKKDERGAVTAFEYGTDTTTITDALLNKTFRREDADGNVVEERDALGRTTRFTYDRGFAGQHGQGRLVRVDFADGSFTTVSYDDAGRKIAETDELGRTTHFGYDDAGRLTSVTNTAGKTTFFGYDEVGNRTSITDANGHTTRFEFDAMGRMTRRTLPLGQTETMQYDRMGNLLSKTDMNGETTTFGYDLQNRMTSRTYPGEATESFTYSPLGRRLTAGSESFSYDPRGRMLTNTKATTEMLTYTYDAAGNRTSVSGPHGSTTYTFDTLGRMATVSHGGSTIATLGYNAVGNLVTIARANGLSTTQVYDDRNRVVEIETRDGPGSLVQSFAYTRDDTGRIRTAEEQPTNRAMAYGYDTAYRLTSEAIVDPAAGNRTISFSYDDVGNRLSKSDTVSGSTTYVFDHNDRLLFELSALGTSTYTFDDNGNVLTKTSPSGFTQFAYDARNLMIEATVGSNVHAYGYDVDGARISKSLNGVLGEQFLVDRNMAHAQVLRETNGAAAEIARHVYGVDDVLWSATAAGPRFMHYDAQRSVRALSNAAGATVDGYVFDAFGNALASSGSTPNDYRYSGERLDEETGLIYLRARQYDPASGRFLRADPFLGVDADPRTLHRYSYAANDAMNARDPSGEETLLGLGMSLSIQSLLGTTQNLRFGNAFHEDASPSRELDLRFALILAQAWSAYHSGGGWSTNYEEWFGRRSPERERTVSNAWSRVGLHLYNRIGFSARRENCEGTLAIVARGGDVIITVCPEWDTAPMAGAWDTKPGTIIHELLHELMGWDLETTDPYQAIRIAREVPDAAVETPNHYQYQAEDRF
jgi:RHS repeat-associated protein